MSSTAAISTEETEAGYRGNDKLLLGIVLAVVTFWLFAGSAGTVAPSIRTTSTPPGSTSTRPR
jgi:DHA2 family multidrug resistance protein-like MFS transporter